jgi:hypothetical protein
MTIDYFDDPVEAPQEATLERLTELAKDAVALEKELEADEAALKEKQGRLDKILMGYIPDIMKELDLEEYKLKDGSKIAVKEDIKTHLSEEHKPEAFAWLRANDFDGIIKTVVSANFGKGEADLAEKAREALVAAGFTQAALSDSVHHTTLKAFVKERLEEGTNIPLDVFGVFEFTKAVITQPKTRK